ncbi:hypothetical protein FCL54_09690 [Pseudalkalibacillus caeni]|uniref:Transmembrane protein n=2 Tax=Exobacillus caeni TaxID=2574798 RepID=A0A5R9F997_9BACL|nr:hypothetical protein FCL54_09690 [Pseudalkalibacillus caeni]
MQNQGKWLPFVASVGLGAAAYYNMTRNQNFGGTMQQMIPLVTGLSGGKQKQKDQTNTQTQQLQ